MAMTRRISPRPAAQREPRRVDADVVSIRPDPANLAPALRAAAGFRVDGPDGRIGIVRGVVPDEPTAPPEELVVTFGLFIVTTVSIAVADVRSVDAPRRRVVVVRTPELPYRTPTGLALRIRRFVRAGARRAAHDAAGTTTRRQR